MQDALKYSDEILRTILGKEMFRELLDYIPDVLDVRIGKNHSPIDGIYITKLLTKFILHIGMAKAHGYSCEQIENFYNPIYKVFIYFYSIQDIYNTFGKYIDVVSDYIKKHYL